MQARAKLARAENTSSLETGDSSEEIAKSRERRKINRDECLDEESTLLVRKSAAMKRSGSNIASLNTSALIEVPAGLRKPTGKKELFGHSLMSACDCIS